MRTREKVRIARKFLLSAERWSVSRLADHYNLLIGEIEDVLRWAATNPHLVVPRGWVRL